MGGFYNYTLHIPIDLFPYLLRLYNISHRVKCVYKHNNYYVPLSFFLF